MRRAVRRHAPQLVERRKHGFQFYAHDGRQIRSDADVFFKGGKKTGKSHADGVKPGRQLLAPEHSLGIRQEAVAGRHSHGFRNQLHARAHLRRARSVAHHSGKLARDRLRLRARRNRREGRYHGGQDQDPQDSEPFLFHFALPPWCSIGRRLGFLRCFHRELCRARNGLTRKRVRSIHFQTVLPR